MDNKMGGECSTHVVVINIYSKC